MPSIAKIKILPVVLTLLLTGLLCAQERIALLQEPYVIILDPADGTVIDAEFIDLTGLSPGTPKAIAQIQDEIWITDQIEDRIDRFDLNGDFLSSINGGMDNIKGLALVNGEVWVTNAGTNNGAPGDAIIRFDTNGTNLGSFDTGGESSFDIIDVGGEVYVSYIGAGTKIERRDYSGAVLGNIVETGVVTFIQQIEVDADNSSILSAVFSTNGGNGPGLYEFAESDGSILNYYDVGSLRGVAKLDDDNILISGPGGVDIFDPVTGTTTAISGDSAQYFGRLDLSPCVPPAAPTGNANQSFSSGATLDDIVVTPSVVTWFATEADATTGDNPLPGSTILVDSTTYYAVDIDGGCISDFLAVTVTITLGLIENDTISLSISPNPVHEVLSLESTITINRVEIYNLLGQKVATFSSPAITTVDVSSLSPNIYLLTAGNGNEFSVVKFVKLAE